MDGHQQDSGPVGRQPSMRGTVAAVSCNDVYSFSKPGREEIVLIAGLGVAGDVHAGVTVRHRSRVGADPDQPNLRQVHLIHSELHEELVEAGYEVPAGGLGENVTTSGIDLLGLPVGAVLRFGPRPTSLAPAGGTGLASAAGTGSASAAGASPFVPVSGLDPAVSGPGLAVSGPGPAVSGPGPEAVVGVGGLPGSADAVVVAAGRANLDAPSAAAVAALSARLATEESLGRSGSPAPDPRPAIVVTGLRNPCQQINHYRAGLLKRVLGRNADGSLSRRAGVMAVVLRGGPIRPGTEIDVELPAPPHRPLDRV